MRSVLMRFRMPVLADIVEFFATFGAFPSGTPRPLFTPQPPDDKPDPLVAVIKEMDAAHRALISGSRGGHEF